MSPTSYQAAPPREGIIAQRRIDSHADQRRNPDDSTPGLSGAKLSATAEVFGAFD